MGFIINNLTPLLYLQEINLVSGSYATIFTQLIPISTTILFYIFRIEEINTIRSKKAICQIFGIFIGCSSAVSIVVFQFEGLDKNKPAKNLILGTAIAVVDNFLFSSQYVFQSKLFYNNPDSILKNRPLTAQSVSYICGFLVFCVVFGPYLYMNFDEIYYLPPTALIPILYSSVIMCSISYGIMAFCNKNTSPILVGSSWSLSVVCSLIFLRIFANESLHIIQYILFLGVFVGVMMVILSPAVEENSNQNVE